MLVRAGRIFSPRFAAKYVLAEEISPGNPDAVFVLYRIFFKFFEHDF